MSVNCVGLRPVSRAGIVLGHELENECNIHMAQRAPSIQDLMTTNGAKIEESWVVRVSMVFAASTP